MASLKDVDVDIVLEEEVGDCLICFETLTQKDRYAFTVKCFHDGVIYHQLCLENWIKKSGTCPCCRQILSVNKDIFVNPVKTKNRNRKQKYCRCSVL